MATPETGVPAGTHHYRTVFQPAVSVDYGEGASVGATVAVRPPATVAETRRTPSASLRAMLRDPDEPTFGEMSRVADLIRESALRTTEFGEAAQESTAAINRLREQIGDSLLERIRRWVLRQHGEREESAR